MMWVTFLREESEAIKKYENFKVMDENETCYKIKCISSDNGGKFRSIEFGDFCKQHGIKRRFTTIETPHQNHVTKRPNRLV